MKTRGLNHIHLLVCDVERSVRFYSDVFEFKRVADHGPEMVFLVKPGTSDVITLRRGESEQIGRSGGIDHFGFLLEDPSELDAAIEHVERHGGRLLERTSIGPGIPSAFVADPDGYRIQI